MKPIDVFTQLLGVNPTAGRFIAIGIMVLAGAAIIAAFGVAEDVLLRLALYLVAFCVIVTVLMTLRGLPSKLIGWAVTSGFICWMTALVAQTVSNNAITWLAPTQCLVTPWSSVCAITQSAEPQPVAEPKADGPIVNPKDAQQVFIQFAGSIQREDVVTLAKKLVDAGWPVQGADHGGERTGAAAGLNEIRYFHAEDRALAERLAQSISGDSPSDRPVEIRDLSKTRFSQHAKLGLLEIWISN